MSSSITPSTSLNPPSLWALVFQGVCKAVSGALWVYKILVPISLATMVLDASHVLDHLEGILGPAMALLHLPARAAMPLIAGVLTGIYGGVASMAVLGLSVRETTLIAVFLLISHNMIQESAVQGSSGIHPIKAALFRLATSLIVVWLMGFFWRGSDHMGVAASMELAPPTGFWLQLKLWGWQTLLLCVKIFLILVCIMTAVTWMKARQVSQHLVRFLGPVLKAMGLGPRVGLLWLTAVLFGVSYGAAVIIEETRSGDWTEEELERLHLSIGINHAMIEDPSLFLSLGVHPLWLWIPRLAAAFLAVHLLRLVRSIRRNQNQDDSEK